MVLEESDSETAGLDQGRELTLGNEPDTLPDTLALGAAPALFFRERVAFFERQTESPTRPEQPADLLEVPPGTLVWCS